MLRRPLLQQRDQLVFASAVTLGLILLTAAYCWPRSWQRRWVDVDATQFAPVQFQLDVNHANWVELSLLPGIGERLAQRIVASRSDEGMFTQPADLLRVRGIGPKTLERIRPHLQPLTSAKNRTP